MFWRERESQFINERVTSIIAKKKKKKPLYYNTFLNLYFDIFLVYRNVIGTFTLLSIFYRFTHVHTFTRVHNVRAFSHLRMLKLAAELHRASPVLMDSSLSISAFVPIKGFSQPVFFFSPLSWPHWGHLEAREDWMVAQAVSVAPWTAKVEDRRNTRRLFPEFLHKKLSHVAWWT